MKVAVLMSSYNGEVYIEKQIESILAQKKTYVSHNGESVNFEIDIIIRDDGSSDMTINILEKYKKQGKIEFYTGRNIGVIDSFFDIICGIGEYDYYSLSDQDDYWLPDKLSRAIELLESEQDNTIPIVYGANAQLVDEDLCSLGRNFYPHKMLTDIKTISCSCGFLGCTMVFNKALLVLMQQFQLPKHAVMHDFYITLLCLAVGGKVMFDEETMILYRQHGNNVCGASATIWNKVRNHIKVLCSIPKRSIAEQAGEILEIYGNAINSENKHWMKKVAEYRLNLINRVSLAISKEYHFYSIERAIPMRLQILFGKI